MASRSWTAAIAMVIILAASCASPSEPEPTAVADASTVPLLVEVCEDPGGCEEEPPPPPPPSEPNCPTSGPIVIGSTTPSGPTTVAVSVEAPHTIGAICADRTIWKATVDGVARSDATYHWYFGVCRDTQNPDGTWKDWNANWCTTDVFTLVRSGVGATQFTTPVWPDVRNVFVYVEVSLGTKTGVSGALRSRGPKNGLYPEPSPSRDVMRCGVFGRPHRYYQASDSTWWDFGRDYCTGRADSLKVGS